MFNKTLKSILLFTLLVGLSVSSTYNRNKCKAGIPDCKSNETCCKAKDTASGWKCFPLMNMVCCSDGINACPEKTKCNLQRMSCDPLALLFLENVQINKYDGELDN